MKTCRILLCTLSECFWLRSEYSSHKTCQIFSATAWLLVHTVTAFISVFVYKFVTVFVYKFVTVFVFAYAFVSVSVFVSVLVSQETRQVLSATGWLLVHTVLTSTSAQVAISPCYKLCSILTGETETDIIVWCILRWLFCKTLNRFQIWGHGLEQA